MRLWTTDTDAYALQYYTLVDEKPPSQGHDVEISDCRRISQQRLLSLPSWASLFCQALPHTEARRIASKFLCLMFSQYTIETTLQHSCAHKLEVGKRRRTTRLHMCIHIVCRNKTTYPAKINWVPSLLPSTLKKSTVYSQVENTKPYWERKKEGSVHWTWRRQSSYYGSSLCFVRHCSTDINFSYINHNKIGWPYGCYLTSV